jgi:hypothetical protein
VDQTTTKIRTNNLLGPAAAAAAATTTTAVAITTTTTPLEFSKWRKVEEKVAMAQQRTWICRNHLQDPTRRTMSSSLRNVRPQQHLGAANESPQLELTTESF